MSTDENVDNNKYSLYFDGCSKNNPGKSGIGAVLYNWKNEEVFAKCKYIGICTNNESEYSALIYGLECSLEQNVKNLLVYGDSQLVINQVTGVYKVKSDTLLNYYRKVLELVKNFDMIEFNHVKREYNKRADQLSNIAIKTMDTIL